MVIDFASTIMTADQTLTTTASEWKITPDRTKPIGEFSSDTPGTTGSANNTAGKTESIKSRLDRGKTEYLNTVAESKRTLMGVIDRRIQEVEDAGNLSLAKSLMKVKETCESEGDIGDDVKDTAILSARTRYAQSIASANQRLADAFQNAIREYTRARQLDAAQSVQTEFDSTGLAAVTSAKGSSSAGNTSSESSAKTYVLKNELPPYLESGGAYNMEGDGIRPDHHKYLRTKDADFLNRDFTFDVWFVAEQKEEVNAWIGIGEGLRNGGYWRPENSVGIEINSMGHMNGQTELFHDRESGEQLGKLPDIGTFIARIQKRGNTLAFLVGSERGGKFAPDFAKRIDDLHKFAPSLNDHNAHLFFGHNTIFTQVRLESTTGHSTGSSPSTSSPAPFIVKLIPPESSTPAPETGGKTAPAPASGSSKSTETPDPAPPTGALKAGLKAEYFSEIHFDAPVASQIDSSIDFEWKSGTKPAEGISTPRYSIRWSGVLEIPSGEIASLELAAHDAARLSIDGKKLLEFHNPSTKTIAGPFTAGHHEIKLEYWNHSGAGHVALKWIPNGKTASESIPTSALLHQE